MLPLVERKRPHCGRCSISFQNSYRQKHVWRLLSIVKQSGNELSPMVKGLLPVEWHEIAQQEITNRSFVLNLSGGRAGLEAELSTGYTHTAWGVLWACFADFGLIPNTM